MLKNADNYYIHTGTNNSSVSNKKGKIMKTKHTINCYEKEVYGNVHIYVQGELQAKMLSVLTGKKTLNYSDLEALQTLGFVINLQCLPTRKQK